MGNSVTTHSYDTHTVTHVHLYYNPFDAKCIKHLNDFEHFRNIYLPFTIFHLVNTIACIDKIPPDIKQIPIYKFAKGPHTVLINPDSSTLSHTFEALCSHGC